MNENAHIYVLSWTKQQQQLKRSSRSDVGRSPSLHSEIGQTDAHDVPSVVDAQFERGGGGLFGLGGGDTAVQTHRRRACAQTTTTRKKRKERNDVSTEGIGRYIPILAALFCPPPCAQICQSDVGDFDSRRRWGLMGLESRRRAEVGPTGREPRGLHRQKTRQAHWQSARKISR